MGEPNDLRDMVPNVMHLNLDKNFLYSWDQFFSITSQLRYLRQLALTGNKFQVIDKTYFDGKNIDQLVHTHLGDLVLIDMSLDWSQIDILSPTFIYVEQLFLVRNNCSKICTQFPISKEFFKNLRYLNLEDNGIDSWDELSDLRILNDL
jgi:Leucine-rich repeat (LRR) protein